MRRLEKQRQRARDGREAGNLAGRKGVSCLRARQAVENGSVA